MTTLTGRRRFRLQPGNWRRGPTLVLQVEVECREVEYLGGYIDSYRVKVWRDATVEDLTVSEARGVA